MVTYRDDNCWWVQMGWGSGVGNGEIAVQMEKDFCPNFVPPFLESIDRRG